MRWLSLKSSVAGTSHSTTETRCQDSCFAETIRMPCGEEVVIAVVADGAGSAQCAAEASSFVCKTFSDEVKETLQGEHSLEGLDLEFGRLFVTYCQEQLRPRADAGGLDLREFATTFIGCVADLSEAVFFQLGDGGAIYSSVDNRERYVMAIPSVQSEYVNMTQFITDPFAMDNLRFFRVPLPLARIALFTDGLQNLAIDYTADDAGIPFAPFFDPMFRPLKDQAPIGHLTEQLDAFLNSETINQRTDDDKTLVLVSRV